MVPAEGDDWGKERREVREAESQDWCWSRAGGSRGSQVFSLGRWERLVLSGELENPAGSCDSPRGGWMHGAQERELVWRQELEGQWPRHYPERGQDRAAREIPTEKRHLGRSWRRRG